MEVLDGEAPGRFWGRGAREVSGLGGAGGFGEAPDGRLNGFALYVCHKKDCLVHPLDA